ncbi:hypothetical protein [Actinosynnema mirum]|uniref:DUF1795 domain-containing protein n=1 Tax=Actinosynnema mirum (strain ATCC 29888 / DSM 43827 / JCM 3225 / NBRC 14064 / NCIMB 13271 / NRRL B-12336 / IMRU 3971 / 101) TaxID=446462 RepID=C6WMP8_ACTMD|nr:hypothetical protein [Actinosynnema mirum]ACU36577.1 hypothetical protein Amir_2642 [Actinosynnema mirum DSM 43827]
MATTIPVPIAFALPQGWIAAPPDEVGSPGAAFVALRPPAIDGFTPNISVTGDFETRSLAELADEAVERLREGVGRLQVGQRTEVGTEESPALTQTLRVQTVLKGKTTELVQSQVLIGMRGGEDPSRVVVLRVILTSTLERFESVVEEFRQFVSTIEPDRAAGGRP